MLTSRTSSYKVMGKKLNFQVYKPDFLNLLPKTLGVGFLSHELLTGQNCCTLIFILVEAELSRFETAKSMSNFDEKMRGYEVKIFITILLFTIHFFVFRRKLIQTLLPKK